jgi:hypothetical protein
LATLSRKYRSCVIATTVPGNVSRWCSSHATLSASRWLVGSSSRSMSGSSSSTLHSATRRRSPPESFVTSASPGRQAQRVHRHLDLVVEVPQVVRVDVLLHARLLVHELLEVGVGLRERGADRVEAVELRALLLERLLDVAAHVLGRVELRLLRQVADARALVRPRLALEVLVDAGHDAQERRLARAVGPSTPILAPG